MFDGKTKKPYKQKDGMQNLESCPVLPGRKEKQKSRQMAMLKVTIMINNESQENIQNTELASNTPLNISVDEKQNKNKLRNRLKLQAPESLLQAGWSIQNFYRE